MESADGDHGKKVVLCDVGGTLLGREDVGDGWDGPNQALIALLNHAVNNLGLEIRLCTSAFDNDTWGYDKRELQAAGLDAKIVSNVGGKRMITPQTHQQVVAIVDNEQAPYVAQVQSANPDAQYFEPLQVAALTRYLQQMKAGGVPQGPG